SISPGRYRSKTARRGWWRERVDVLPAHPLTDCALDRRFRPTGRTIPGHLDENARRPRVELGPDGTRPALGAAPARCGELGGGPGAARHFFLGLRSRAADTKDNPKNRRHRHPAAREG